jgi:hypothetical protein
MHRPRTILVIYLLLISMVSSAYGKIIEQWDFEDKSPLHHLTIQGDKPQIVADPQDANNKVMKATLRPNAKRPERSEVMPGFIINGQERWIGARILRINSVHHGFTCFFQLGPVDGDPTHGGGGLYQLNCYDTKTWKFRSFLERVGQTGTHTNAGPITYGTWDDWVFHVKLGADKSGLIEVWRNGKLIHKRAGQNIFPKDRMRIKWGVYVGKGNLVPAEINAYYDDITIGDESSNYQEMVPKHNKPALNPAHPANKPSQDKN